MVVGIGVDITSFGSGSGLEIQRTGSSTLRLDNVGDVSIELVAGDTVGLLETRTNSDLYVSYIIDN